MASEDITVVLMILAEAAKMMPIVGRQIRDCCGVLSEICRITMDVKGTAQYDFLALVKYPTETLVKIGEVVRQSDAVKREDYHLGLKQIESVLHKIQDQAIKAKRQSGYLRFLTMTKTREQLVMLREELHQACTQLEFMAQLSESPLTMDQLKTEVDHLRNTLFKAHALRRCHETLLPITADAFAHHVRRRVKLCHNGTRTGTIENIMAWARATDNTAAPIYWLSGLAGTGKSTAALTICEKLSEGVTTASFFTSASSPQYCEQRKIPGTLAYQLARQDPSICRYIYDIVNGTSDISSYTLSELVQALLVTPLQQAELSHPLVIIIDALDECDGDGVSLMSLLVEGLLAPPGLLHHVRLLVTSRETFPIRNMFTDLQKKHANHILSYKLQDCDVESDISFYLTARLRAIGAQHALSAEAEQWPKAEDIDRLVKLSGKLFVYATTMVRCFELGSQFDTDPRAIVKVLQEGDESIIPYDQLDGLYMRALDRAIPFVAGLDTRFREVVGIIVALRVPQDAVFLDNMLCLDKGSVMGMVKHLRALLVVPDVGPISLFHRSFADFITTQRCNNLRFRINLPEIHLSLSIQCLKVMNETSLKLGAKLADADLTSVSPESAYARDNWPAHLRSATGAERSTPEFLEKIYVEIKQYNEVWQWPLNFTVDKGDGLGHIKSFCDNDVKSWGRKNNTPQDFPTQVFKALVRAEADMLARNKEFPWQLPLSKIRQHTLQSL